MKTIVNNSTDPYFNLALEEYLLRKWRGDAEEAFYLWQNSPSIIVGRNQNVFSEVNLKEAEKDGVPVIRRISGGGSVYHDLGNLNFSFLASYTKENLNNYRKFTEPVIGVLRGLGIPAAFSGKSDIKVGEKKISGNAQSFHGRRMLHHGTLLFDSDLVRLRRYLKANDGISSHAVRSNPSAVANLKEYLPAGYEIAALMRALQEGIASTGAEPIFLSAEEISEVRELREEKYLSWDWNYGESPEFSLQNEAATVHVKAGRIADFHSGLLSETMNKKLKEILVGKRFIEKEIRPLLAVLDAAAAERIIVSLFG